MLSATLFTDGGSRGNPGISGCGFVLTSVEGEMIAEGGWYLKRATNNVAEYSALVWGLKNALEAQVTNIKVCADSELIVKQILGFYKVKSEDLKPLYQQAQDIFSRFDTHVISHVYREDNKEADALANQAMDSKGPVGNFRVPWEETSSTKETNVAKEISLPKETNPVQETNPTLFDMLDSAQSSENVRGEDSFMKKNTIYVGKGQLSGESYEDRGGVYELTVKDHFDAAHTLVGYAGPCQYLHGHTWDVEVRVSGKQLDSVGILYDFKDIKRDLHAILNNFDHRYINDTPPFDVINPTAEHLARVIFFELEQELPSEILLEEVAVWESPAARVSYRRMTK